jgi:MSHA biogenesis protein MshP
VNERSASLRRQRGISLVAALFLLVVLAALGIFAVRIATMQQQTVASAARGAEALHAAKAGAAWAAHRAIAAGWCAGATLNLTEGAAAGFDVTVQCTLSAHTEGTDTVDVYIIDVLAESGVYGGPDYVSRRLQIKLTDAA